MARRRIGRRAFAASQIQRQCQLCERSATAIRQPFRNLARQLPNPGNMRGPNGTTPLMQAVLYGDAESVRLLLDAAPILIFETKQARRR